MRLTTFLSVAALAFACSAGAQAQQAYPSRPITIIVPFAAGGPSDAITRIVAERLGQELGERIVIQNAGGAGGTIGSNRVVTSDPDGYTLLMHHIGLSTTPALYKKSLPFDPMKDLKPIGLVAEAPMSIIARRDFPPNDLKELIGYLRERKDKTAYASAGIGGASFLCGLLLEQRLGVKFTQVPYTGVAPAYTDMLSGRTDVMCDLTTGTAGYIQTDKLKPYALTAAKRISTLPDLPTTAEAGMPDFEVSVWYGLYAPAKTPTEVVQRLSKALQAVMQDPKVAERLATTGTTLVTPDQATPEALAKRLKGQVELWTPIIERSGVSTD